MGFILLSLLAGTFFSTGFHDDSEAGVRLLSTDAEQMVVDLQIPDYTIENSGPYTRFFVAGQGRDLNTPMGDPEFPVIPVEIAIPMGVDPVLELSPVEWTDVGTGIPFPAQPLEYDCGPFHYSFAELNGDLAGIHPRSAVTLGESGTWAGVNTAVIEFHPFRWNAETGVFQVASSMTVTVRYEGSREHQPSVSPEVAAMHSSRLLNYQELSVPVNRSPLGEDDIVYVCVVPPGNLETVTPLLAMVNALGHHVHIIEMEEGSTSYQIRAAINQVYQPGITRFALIPARHQQLESKEYSGFVGDFYYECLDSDNLPDIAVGRYPGNHTQLENQTAKAMSYVQWTGTPGEPPVSSSVILCAHEEDYPGKYTANSNAVKNATYSLANLQFETCYPDEGGTAEQVQNAINDGVGIVNYRGHGSTTTWQWSPGWNAGLIYGLENTFFPPVFNVCCNNGEHNLTYNCLSESWLDAPGVGCSGNLGASSPSLTVVNNAMQLELFQQIFTDGNTCAGEMFAASQAYIIQNQGGGGLSNARMYHWFGDPSMDICNSDEAGAPFPLSIDVPSSVNAGAVELELTVTSSGTPVSGAVVTVTDGIGNHPGNTETFYRQGTTDGSGGVVLSFEATGGKDLFYGVRLHNHGSITGEIAVSTQGIQGGNTGNIGLDPVYPSPASASASLSFQAPQGTEVNLSVLDLAGRTVSVLHSDQAPGGTVNLQMDTGSLAPGIYFAVMTAPGFTATERITVVR